MDDPLADLRDWHLPDPIAWWPPAPGWWLLALIGLVALTLLVFWWRRRRRAMAPTRAAVRQLEGLVERLAHDGDARGFVAGVSLLLRRVALARFPRAEVAGLTGADWLAFLDRTGGGDAFSNGVGRALIEAAYRAESAADAGVDVVALKALALQWIQARDRSASTDKKSQPERAAAVSVHAPHLVASQPHQDRVAS